MNCTKKSDLNNTYRCRSLGMVYFVAYVKCMLYNMLNIWSN